jgi:hypothetical protein
MLTINFENITLHSHFHVQLSVELIFHKCQLYEFLQPSTDDYQVGYNFPVPVFLNF